MVPNDDCLVQRSKMFRESPPCVLGLNQVHVQPNVVVPREIMHRGSVRRYRKHLHEGFVVGLIPKRTKVHWF